VGWKDSSSCNGRGWGNKLGSPRSVLGPPSRVEGILITAPLDFVAICSRRDTERPMDVASMNMEDGRRLQMGIKREEAMAYPFRQVVRLQEALKKATK